MHRVESYFLRFCRNVIDNR